MECFSSRSQGDYACIYSFLSVLNNLHDNTLNSHPAPVLRSSSGMQQYLSRCDSKKRMAHILHLTEALQSNELKLLHPTDIHRLVLPMLGDSMTGLYVRQQGKIQTELQIYILSPALNLKLSSSRFWSWRHHVGFLAQRAASADLHNIRFSHDD